MLGKLIRELRSLNISQRELAQKIGVSHSYISKLEAGMSSIPTDEILERLSEVLECDLSIFYIACGKIPPDKLAINVNAPSIYSELEHFLRTRFICAEQMKHDIEVMQFAYDHSEVASFIYNMDTEKFAYINKNGFSFLKKAFPERMTEEILKEYILIYQNRKKLSLPDSYLLTIESGGEHALMDLHLEKFCYKETEYLLIQLHDKIPMDRFNQYAWNSRAHFSGVFSHALKAVMVIERLDDDSMGKIKHVNDAACTLLEYTQDECLSLTGMAAFELQTDTTLARLKRLLKENRSHDISVFKTKSGLFVPVEIHSHTGTWGNHQFYMLIFSDLNTFKLPPADSVKTAVADDESNTISIVL